MRNSVCVLGAYWWRAERPIATSQTNKKQHDQIWMMDTQEHDSRGYTHILCLLNPLIVSSSYSLLVNDIASYFIKMAKAILKVLVYCLISTAWFYTHPHIWIKTSLPASSSPHLHHSCFLLQPKHLPKSQFPLWHSAQKPSKNLHVYQHGPLKFDCGYFQHKCSQCRSFPFIF